jgi:hypothetical protein
MPMTGHTDETGSSESGSAPWSVQPTPEQLAALTPLNPFGRLPDGRPHVPDDLLDRLVRATTEQAWDVLRRHGYLAQFAGGWRETHPGRVTVGRALTAQFLPFRPDYDAVVQAGGRAAGRGASGGQNSWVIESLGPRDVMVVDLFGKVKARWSATTSAPRSPSAPGPGR